MPPTSVPPSNPTGTVVPHWGQCGGQGWAGRDLLDLGCGSGFHLPRWAVEARSVVGVEPHPGLVALAARRTARLDNVTVLPGSFLARSAHGVNPGAGYIRIALVAGMAECLDAATRIADCVHRT